jgi:hypothetical protein
MERGASGSGATTQRMNLLGGESGVTLARLSFAFLFSTLLLEGWARTPALHSRDPLRHNRFSPQRRRHLRVRVRRRSSLPVANARHDLTAAQRREFYKAMRGS